MSRLSKTPLFSAARLSLLTGLLSLGLPLAAFAQDSIYINEIQVSTTGTDWEFFELLGRPGAPLGHLTLLVIESDAGTSAGAIDRVISLADQVIDANGYFTAGSPAAEVAYSTTFNLGIPDNTFENSTTTYLLVTDFSGALGDDLDTDNNGTLDITPWTSVVDGVNLWDGGVSDVSYSPNIVGPNGTFLPSGTYRCNGEFDDNLLDFDTPDGTPGALNSQCAAATVYLNEITVSTTGTDWEFFEVQGNPGTDLGGSTLVSIESDSSETTNRGRIDRIGTLAGPIPRDGFWVAMSPTAATTYGFSGDFAIIDNFFENGSTTNLLVAGFSGSVGSDVDSSNDGVLDTIFWTTVSDGVALIDNVADFNYLDVTAVGPDGSFLPAGAIRCNNAPAGAFSLANIHNFSTPDGTPGVANTCGGPAAPPQVAATDPVNGSNGVPADQVITVTFNTPVDISGDYAELYCVNSGITDTFGLGGEGLTEVFFTPSNEFLIGDTCIVTLFSDAISQSSAEVQDVDAGSGVALVNLDGNGDGIPGGNYLFSFLVSDEIPIGECGDDATLISAIQGSGSGSPLVGMGHVIEGIVVGDYQETSSSNPARPELRGFFVQEEDADNDADPATSEGIFVFDPDKTLEIAEGDLVRVAGIVSEFFGNTQIDNISGLLSCDTGQSVTPATIDLPIPMSFATIDEFWEQYEGMLLSFSDAMTVTEQFELARFGQLTLSQGGLLRQYSQDAALPLNQPDYLAWLDDQARRSIKLDDFNTQQNIDPVYHPQPGFAVDNFIRIGATTSLQGVLEVRFDEWNLQPQKTATVAFANPPRPVAPPALAGNVRVAALNVLNYFNGDGLGGGFPTSRGADSQAELDRQTDKIVAAIIGLNADVVGLMEIENDGDGVNDSLAQLVDAINAAAGAGTYDFVRASTNGGTDAIKVSLIYKPAVVETAGVSQVLATAAFTNPNGLAGQQSRPALAQTFRVVDVANPDIGSAFTAVVLHLKSKGSGCGAGDDNPVQGNCNGTRTKGIMALLDWLATDPTNTLLNIGVADPDVFIMGDLNAYYQEDPMQVLYNAGYTNLIAQSDASYVFDGNQGSLDHILASPSLSAQSLAGAVWDINAEENALLDYNDTVLDPGEASFEAKPPTNPLFAADAYRSSDHDPVLTGADLADAPVVDATVPADNATDVDLGSNIEISFAASVNATASSFTIVCNETGAHSFVLSGGPADFTLNPDIDFGLTESCTVTVLAGEVFEPIGSTPMREDYVFTFGTSASSRAVISVVKDFNDGNPGEVNVLLDCNTGLILDQDKTISEGDGVQFIVTQFDPTELDCTVIEAPVPGYETLYDNGVEVSVAGCVFEQIMTTTVQNCVVHNHLLPVDVIVTKEWVINGLGDELPMEATADYQCYNLASIDPEQCSADSVNAETPAVYESYLQFSGMTDSESFSILPNWNGSSWCVISEQVNDDSVEADDSDCQNVPVLVGQEAVGCTIVNTRFFEGIPTLSRINLILLSVLMLVVSLVAVRRYGS